jgi:exodeoxyribonuclease VII large subunit
MNDLIFDRAQETDKDYTVSEINSAVRVLLERRFDGIWVEAEVVEVSRARSGHVYFTLSDPGGKAELRSVIWKGPAMRYGSRLKSGIGVRCHGRLTLYEARGTYQFVVNRVEEAGAGIKARILAELKEKLAAEGLFAPERKRPLPLFPNCIGVVTSRDGAALRDIIKVASRRFPVRIVLAHATVQGESAPREIVKALNLMALNKDVEAVIVGRGGGSSEDLDGFNAEEVVRAMAGHPRPVVSAVGHETDITLADLVADKRAATPSEAAEILVPDGQMLSDRLVGSKIALEQAILLHLGVHREKHAIMAHNLRAHDPRVKLRWSMDRLMRAREGLAAWPGRTLAPARQDYALLRDALSHWPAPALTHAQSQLGRLTASLDALSPLASLSRGYAVVRRQPDGEIVRSAKQAPTGTELDVTLAKGSLLCAVKQSKI